METEIHENLKIGVGLIEQRPEAAHGHTLINTTWVYSTKLKDGEIVFKARLTARGDQEDPANINDDHRASPTADQDSIRLILAELANMPGAKLMSFDFVRAYLQARMPTDAKPIFVRVPAGFGKEFPWKDFFTRSQPVWPCRSSLQVVHGIMLRHGGARLEPRQH